jgi:hypothetical protein
MTVPASWTVPSADAVDGPLVGPDRLMLEAYLAWERATFVNICVGLDGQQLAARPLASSRLSLLGLARHLAKVERIWLRQRAAAEPVGPLYDLDRGHDHDFEELDPSAAEAVFDRLAAEWRAADAAVRSLDFDHEFPVGEETFSLRMVYVHLIGEYARHNGHADLLRESIDGVTGR